MDKEVIINLIVKRVLNGEKLRDVLDDFNIPQPPIKQLCWRCNEEIKRNDEVFQWGELEGDYTQAAHVYCVIPF